MTPEQLKARNAAIASAWEDPLRRALASQRKQNGGRRTSRATLNAYQRDYERHRYRPHYFPPVIDEDFDDEPQFDFADAIHRWRTGPQTFSIYDQFPSTGISLTMGWEDAEQFAHKANRTHSAYLTDSLNAERKAQRELLKQAVVEATAAAAAEREVRAKATAERTRIARERWEAKKRADERWWILHENWGCAHCKGAAIICPEGDKWRLTCQGCPRTVIVEHARVMEVMNAPRPA